MRDLMGFHCRIMMALLFVLVMFVSSFPVMSLSLSNATSTCLSGATPFQLSSTVALGWYSPLFDAADPNTFPVSCPPTNDCMLDRVTTKFCSAQGLYEPMLCEPGNYCPSATEQLECPSKHYCPRGQFEPIPCPALSTCAAGSSKKFDYSSIVAIILFDALLVAVWLAALQWKKRHLAERDKQYQKVQLSSINASLYAKGALYNDLPAHSKLLCQGFRRAQKDLPVMRIEFNELSLTKPAPQSGMSGKTILKGVTGSVEPGRVTAIMGPSGAGKTTFLNTMLGNVDSSWTRGGSLRINGVEEKLGRFHSIIGYVPQEDIMHRDLTVYDNIRYSAEVRLPREWTAKQRADHLNATISAMQLKHVQDTRIGDEVTRGISGGQRKRVNIGMEVAAAPLLLLLDEPTSGLDSTSAMEICQVLKDLARVSSITVCMVVHQPRREIWDQLDELLLLAPGGLTVYQGPQRVAVQYFAQRFDVQLAPSENPADALMDCIAEQAEEFVRSWRDGGVQFVEQLKSAGSLADPSPPPIDVPDEDDDPDLMVADYAQAERNLEIRESAPSATTELALAHGSNSSGQVKVQVVSRNFGDIPSHEHLLAPSASNSLPVAFRDDGKPLRQTASFLSQLKLSIQRNLWKQAANRSSFTLEVGLGMFAGFVMGMLVKIKWQGVLLPPYTLLSPTPMDYVIGTFFNSVGLAISLAATSAGVSVFGEEQIIYRREVAAGHNHLAYYLGTNLAQYPRLFVDGIHFAWLFHMPNQPLASFGNFLGIAFFLYCAIYGLAFFVSMVVSRKNAALLGVVLSLLFSNMTAKGGFPEPLQYLSASRWATEALFTLETQPYRHVMDVSGTANRLGYVLDRYSLDLFMMFLVGILYRFIAYIAMFVSDRKIVKGSG